MSGPRQKRRANLKDEGGRRIGSSFTAIWAASPRVEGLYLRGQDPSRSLGWGVVLAVAADRYQDLPGFGLLQRIGREGFAFRGSEGTGATGEFEWSPSGFQARATKGR